MKSSSFLASRALGTTIPQGLFGDLLRVLLETSPNMACVESIIAGHINVSHETREANIVEGQPGYALPLPQLQVIRGSR